MTREQDQAIDTLCLKYGRVCAQDGFSDGLARATVPNGRSFLITEDGIVKDAGVNFSIKSVDFYA